MIFFMQFGSLQSVQFSVLVFIAKWVWFKSSLNKNSFNIPWLHGNPFSWSRARVQGPSLTFAQVVWVVASALTPPARREGRAGVKQCNVDECFPSWEEVEAALSCMTNVPRWQHAVTQCTAKLPAVALQCCKMPCQSIPSQSAAVLILQMKLNAECIQNFPNQYPHLFQWTLHWCSKWPKLIICCCCCVEVGGGMRPEPDVSSGQGWSADTDNAAAVTSHQPPASPRYCPLEVPPTPTKLLPDLYRDCIQTAFNIQ